MKIGIVTFHNVYNYGGMLQAYALCKFLNGKGNNCICIDYQQPTLTEKYSHKIWSSKKGILGNLKHFVGYYLLRRNYKKEMLFNKFMRSHIPLSNKIDRLEDFRKLSEDFDAMVSGSDQLWNPVFTGGKLDPVYFLATQTEVRKFAYASSAGAYTYSDGELQEVKAFLSHYEKVAVREEFLCKQLEPHIDGVSVVVDPTLLLNREQWLEIKSEIPNLPNEYVLLYTFDNDLESIRIAKKVSESLKIPIVSLFRVKSKEIDFTLDNLSPQQFLELVDRCSFVVTNSFHGTAFSINFNKDFFSIYKKSNPHRVLNLLSKLTLESRVVKKLEELPPQEEWKIAYAEAQRSLEIQRERAGNFLNII